MKTIYRKIILVLILGFFIQMISFGIFYRHVVINRIISEINYQENERQFIVHEIIDELRKTGEIESIKDILEKNSIKYDAKFTLKDTEGNLIYSSKNNHSGIEEQGYLKLGGTVEYVVTGYFPPMVNKSKFNIKRQIGRLIIIIVMIIISAFILLIIYRTIANPLKNLSKAVNNIEYGNTLIEIPYYGDDEFGMLCRSFEQMGKRLKASEDNQQELIQAVSHDIKTPLTSIIGYSKRLSEGKVKDEKKEEYYNIICKRANDLKALVEELEEYSNINSESKFNKELFNCRNSFEKLCIEFKMEVQGKGCKFNYYNLIDEALVLSFDKKKIKRLFENLIHNSLKYAGESCSIELKGISEKDYIKFQIKDNGGGVSENQLDKIFDRFYRVDSSRCREKGGTGLGLAICKDIVEKHGGDIRAENLPQGGFCINVIFPKI